MGLTPHQIMAQLKVSEGAVHINLKSFSETQSLARKDPPSEVQYIYSSSLRDGTTTSSSNVLMYNGYYTVSQNVVIHHQVLPMFYTD